MLHFLVYALYVAKIRAKQLHLYTSFSILEPLNFIQDLLVISHHQEQCDFFLTIITTQFLAWIFYRERSEAEGFGGRTEGPGGAPRDGGLWAAAGEDKIRLKVTTVKAERVEHDASMMQQCQADFHFFNALTQFYPLSVSLMAMTTPCLWSSGPQHQAGTNFRATGAEQTVQQDRHS